MISTRTIRRTPISSPLLQATSSTPITPQTDFYDGSFINSEWTNNLDFNRDFAVGLASPLNLAFGAE